MIPISNQSTASHGLQPSDRQLQLSSKQQVVLPEDCPSSQIRVRRDSGYVHVAVKFDRTSVHRLIDRPYIRSIRTGSMSMSEEQVMENSSEAPIVEEEDINIAEVLQESDVEHFGNAKDEMDDTSATSDIEIVKKVVSFDEAQENTHISSIHIDKELAIENEVEKVRCDISMVDPSNEIEKQSSEVLNPKKLDLNVWPPRASSAVLDAKPKVATEEILPKKKINDLIARFNSGNLENDSPRKDFDYKNEYGATKSVGKIHTDVFH